MKKLKYVLMSLSLVFCFLFLSACGGGNPPANPNQLDSNPTLNTSGDYSTILSKDEFDNALTKDAEDGSSNKEGIIKYDENITGIRYFMKTEISNIKMEINAIMKFSLTDATSPIQCAMKITMRLPEDYTQQMGLDNSPIISYAYVKDFNENRIYVASEYAGLKLKEYYTLDGANDSITGGIEGAASFDPTELYEMITQMTGELAENISYTKTEKDADGVVKYKLSFVPSSPDDTIQDVTTPVTTGNLDIYLIVKEVENDVYFQGFSVDMNLTQGEGDDAVTEKTSMIVSLFTGDIEFPDFSDYVEGTTD